MNTCKFSVRCVREHEPAALDAVEREDVPPRVVDANEATERRLEVVDGDDARQRRHAIPAKRWRCGGHDTRTRNGVDEPIRFQRRCEGRLDDRVAVVEETWCSARDVPEASFHYALPQRGGHDTRTREHV